MWLQLSMIRQQFTRTPKLVAVLLSEILWRINLRAAWSACPGPEFAPTRAERSEGDSADRLNNHRRFHRLGWNT